VAFLEHVRVVVRELFARLDVANGLDPNATVVDHGVAIRIARVIDESRLVAVDGGVDHDVVVDREQERVMSFAVDVGISRVGFGGREPLTRVFDETRPRGNSARSECTEPLNRRRANLEWIVAVGQGPFSVFCST
jgi:hypothetical protein